VTAGSVPAPSPPAFGALPSRGDSQRLPVGSAELPDDLQYLDSPNLEEENLHPGGVLRIAHAPDDMIQEAISQERW
jgi:hypothetical protein